MPIEEGPDEVSGRLFAIELVAGGSLLESVLVIFANGAAILPGWR
jgi:hypothetical protein